MQGLGGSRNCSPERGRKNYMFFYEPSNQIELHISLNTYHIFISSHHVSSCIVSLSRAGLQVVGYGAHTFSPPSSSLVAICLSFHDRLCLLLCNCSLKILIPLKPFVAYVTYESICCH
ncbi:hypothetical protein PIB30_017081 [Stylosanthes scabra]|uniref:Uncharacterized protein n=1 Tax=Stylosanthes scabra TaxID=79078 RepID=A0ABU6T7S9_9FABA|nr:hypothetical protein [Stylosanthes scabra]